MNRFMGLQFLYQRIGNSYWRINHGFRLLSIVLLLVEQDFIGKAKFYRLLCIEPGFVIHHVRNLRAGQAALDFVGVDDALLDFAQHTDGLSISAWSP